MNLLHRLNPTVTALKKSGIRAITQEARAIPGCVFLTIGEPDGAMPEEIKKSIAASLMADATHYPPNAGEDALRRRVACLLYTSAHPLVVDMTDVRRRRRLDRPVLKRIADRLRCVVRNGEG